MGQTVTVNSEKFLKRKKVQPHEKCLELKSSLFLCTRCYKDYKGSVMDYCYSILG